MAENGKSHRHARVTDTAKLQVGRVYARALLEAALNAGKAEVVAEELDVLAEVGRTNPQFRAVIEQARLTHEELESLFDRTLKGKADDLILNFVKVLVRHDRLDCLQAVAYEYHMAHDHARGHVEVEIRTAVPLADEHLANITGRLRDSMKREPDVVTVEDPDILGGVIIQIEDTVFDGSLSTQLARLREQMLNRSIHVIERERDRFSTPEGD